MIGDYTYEWETTIFRDGEFIKHKLRKVFNSSVYKHSKQIASLSKNKSALLSSPYRDKWVFVCKDGINKDEFNIILNFWSTLIKSEVVFNGKKD